MKTKSILGYLFAAGALFGGALGLGNEQAEAKMIIEGNEETVLQFIPNVQEDGTLKINRTAEGNAWEDWFSGRKASITSIANGELIGPEVAYVVSNMLDFRQFDEVGGVFTVGTVEEEYNYDIDDSGYFIFDSNQTNQVNIGYTRTENRLQTPEDSEYSYETEKSGVLFSEAHSLYMAVEMLKSEVRLNQIFAHPVLRFEAALVKGDCTAQFALGNNGNYTYNQYGKIPLHGGSEGSQVYHYQGREYQEFYMPLAENFCGPSKLFIDVDAKTIGQQTEYSFRNFQVVLERYVPITMASYEELQLLDGIGVTLAQRIIEYRETVGFNSLDDLLNVKGIGAATLAKINAQGLARVSNYFN
ncbi:ComEA family DNA-binding protein [Enterococcus larvae]|uniref:ComEA family DNA-binding protein n=1 Tax=Enterococcus larvae TaxID=2794352 RepID=UPI003F3509E0